MTDLHSDTMKTTKFGDNIFCYIIQTTRISLKISETSIYRAIQFNLKTIMLVINSYWPRKQCFKRLTILQFFYKINIHMSVFICNISLNISSSKKIQKSYMIC